MIQDFTKHLFKNLAGKEELFLSFLDSFLKSHIFNHFLVTLEDAELKKWSFEKVNTSPLFPLDALILKL